MNTTKKQEEQRKENERLRKEAEEREKLEAEQRQKQEKRSHEMKPYIVFIRDYNDMLNLSDGDYAKELGDIKKAANEYWEHERKEKEQREKEEKERIARENKARLERERIAKEEKLKREKLEAELRKKQETEERERKESEAKRQAELNKGDAAKVKDLIADLIEIKNKYVFESSKNRKMYKVVGVLIDKVIGYIEKK